jgi:hypothetical protein
MDSAPEGSFDSKSDIFVYSEETGFSEEERIGKEEITDSDIVRKSHGENVNKNTGRRNEREETFERVVRSPQKFDDDVESSEERNNRRKEKVKDILNKRGRGKNRRKGRGKSNDSSSEGSYEKHSLIRGN